MSKADSMNPAAIMNARGAARLPGFRHGRWGAVLSALAGVALFLLVWVFAAWMLPTSRLASPVAVFRDVFRNLLLSPRLSVFGLGKVGYLDLMLYTTRNVLLGLVTGSAVGILLGTLSAKLGGLRLIVDPIVLVLGTVPVLIAAPLFLLWFGVVPFTQVLLVALYSAVMMALFSQKAVENLDPIYERAAMTVGASLAVRIRFILVPGTLPEIIGGLRIALASAWGLETFAEIMGAPSGIGQAIKALVNVNNVPGMMACVMLVAGTAIMTDLLLVLVTRRVIRWT